MKLWGSLSDLVLHLVLNLVRASFQKRFLKEHGHLNVWCCYWSGAWCCCWCCSCWVLLLLMVPLVLYWGVSQGVRTRRFVTSVALDIWKESLFYANIYIYFFLFFFFHVAKTAFYAVFWYNHTWIIVKFIARSRWVWIVFYCVCISLFFCRWNILRFWTIFLCWRTLGVIFFGLG